MHPIDHVLRYYQRLCETPEPSKPHKAERLRLAKAQAEKEYRRLLKITSEYSPEHRSGRPPARLLKMVAMLGALGVHRMR